MREFQKDTKGLTGDADRKPETAVHRDIVGEDTNTYKIGIRVC